jgi:uncharacterized cupin superfamily protein
VVEGKRWKTARLDELETDGRRILVRRQLDIRAFGVNAWRGAAPGDRVIDDHDEVVEGHEELYLVLAGRAVFDFDDGEVDAPAGTLLLSLPKRDGARLQPSPTRSC